MVSCIQITLQHQSVLGFRRVSFKSEVHILPPSDLNVLTPHSPRLTALEKEALSVCDITTTDGRTDGQAVLYFSLITGFTE